ncbi:MAG: sugar ABC transporter permease, partial [Chloroflexota bacterium]
MTRRTFLTFTAPSVVIMTLLMVIPFATAIWLGFYNITFRSINNPQFVGWANYQEVLTDGGFWQAAGFTAIFIMVVVPMHIIVGFVIALLIDQTNRSRGFYIAGSLLPFIVTPVVGTLMFRQIFDRNGLYPYLLELMGYDVNFFINGTWVRALILFHGVWYMTPFAMITLFAGLQTVPKEPLEAAIVDGATWLERMW